ncbi:hypothetical protein BAUCODRAFT_65852 [Baudoinia panamericana UAMH 10762]|uniref:Uncharacterized protein n=1 Tax=Baudoinia panamericana (strain UAMH 10762) TaxID=717646 RepID=M2NH82_BAUPA|nr:uncharacterized protein BAUCODRAFT_65852 [Baudoinia panamericana UAMH 10762]EMC98694.1 hypothetical protein BAUCODRAFT_65852 [Baudoinia panamericana UAMH 10762]
MSAAKQEDQGRLDLTKSVTENDRLAGLGIQDFGTRSVSDLTSPPAARRGTHARTTSVGSQMSTASGSYRANQPFVHPMRQTPRPYTPPAGSSNVSVADEAADIFDDEYRLGHGYRSNRSMSISSAAPGLPTPLSQSHTADDLGLVPKLTSHSQTNLSIRSGKSSKSKLGRARGDTSRSFDQANPSSSRTSFDKAFSFVSRKSDSEPQTRDERIRAERQKFQEKEANKDRKLEQERSKRKETDERRRDRQRRKSEASLRAQRAQHAASGGPKKSKKVVDAEDDNEKLRSRSYEDYRPAHHMTLPRQGVEAGTSEKAPRAPERKTSAPQSGWIRFWAWLHTRMLSCGGR